MTASPRSRLALSAILLLAAWGDTVWAQDQDEDGVHDDIDAHPCDITRASTLFAPGAAGWTLLAFEDRWPDFTDLDFNDVVVRVNYRFALDAGGRVRELEAFVAPEALGTAADVGLALQLPVAAPDAALQLQVGDEAPVVVQAEPDARLTVVLTRNLRAQFGGLAGRINTQPERPRVAAEQLALRVTFSASVDLDVGEAPFDIFIFRTSDFGHQTHLPYYPGTAAMDPTRLGTGVDASTDSLRFVHRNGTPFALNLQSGLHYPVEGTPLHRLFGDLEAFVRSGGQARTGFYSSNLELEHGIELEARPVPEAPLADTACLPDGFERCGDTIRVDGVAYGTTPYGAQCWFDRPLNRGVTLADVEVRPTNPRLAEKWCYGDAPSACVTAGGLYTWSEAMAGALTEGARGICPVGWRIPTEADWQALEITFGVPPGQVDVDGMHTFAVAFAGVFADGVYPGTRFEAGNPGPSLYNDGGTQAAYWSSTVGVEYDGYSTIMARLFFSGATTMVQRIPITQTHGLSVRCVQ